jgi:CHAD domain-containing protein
VLGTAPTAITAHDPLETAARKAMWPQLERLLAREGHLGDPERADDLRRYRVAVRRLRAAVRTLGDGLPERQLKPIRRGLGNLARTLGAVRDLDLRIADLERWAGERGDASRAGIEPLRAAWGAERERATRALLAHLETRRHRRLVDRLAAFVDGSVPPGRGGGFAGPSTIGDRLGSTIWSAYEEVRSYAAVVRWADLETLHGLRIAAKRLRDGLDLLGDLVGPARTPVTQRLVRLQDHLGALQDAAVTSAAVRAFLESQHGRLSPEEQQEIAAYLSDRERLVGRLRRASVAPWRSVVGITTARRIGRLVVMPAGVPTPARQRAAQVGVIGTG